MSVEDWQNDYWERRQDVLCKTAPYLHRVVGRRLWWPVLSGVCFATWRVGVVRCSENSPEDRKRSCPGIMLLVVHYAMYRVTHGNLTSFEWAVLRTAPKKNKLCQCVVSTGWCHSAHCKRVNVHCSKHVSRAPHFPFRRSAVAPLLSQSFNGWFFSLGSIWNRMFTLTNPIRWMTWRKPSVREFIRSIVSCWPVSWIILKRGLKTASKKTVVILPITSLKLNHLVWHVLSFNFV